MVNLLPSLFRYFLVALSAAITRGLIDHGFNPADAEQFGQAFSAFALAAIVLVWSAKKNTKQAETLAQKDARIKKLESDPITWKTPRKGDKYND